MLFNSFKMFIADIQSLSDKQAFAGGKNSPGHNARKRAWIRILMQVVITVLCLAMGFYIFLSRSSSESDKKYGTFLIGTAMGYWLR